VEVATQVSLKEKDFCVWVSEAVWKGDVGLRIEAFGKGECDPRKQVDWILRGGFWGVIKKGN